MGLLNLDIGLISIPTLLFCIVLFPLEWVNAVKYR